MNENVPEIKESVEYKFIPMVDSSGQPIQSIDISELATALAKAQSEIEGAKKSSDNPFFKSKYADLSEVISASRPALTKNGLSVVQVMVPGESGRTILVTTLLHVSGQWVRSYYPILPVKSDPQGVGSAITYARRYSYAALVGVAQEDDDAEGAMARNQRQPSDLKSRCAEHGVEMTAGVSKTGTDYWYHKNEKGEMCFGKGYQDKK